MLIRDMTDKKVIYNTLFLTRGETFVSEKTIFNNTIEYPYK